MNVITQYASPNFGERDAAVPVQYIVLHYTGMRSAEAARDWLCDPASEVSAHYMIAETGQIYYLVDETKRAWHAGVSFWRGITDLNSASIGIELCNPGHHLGYRPFPAAQIDGLQELLRDIMQRHALPASAVLAHAEIAPARKEDPGELFPWRQLAQAGFGLWTETKPEDYGHADDGEVQEMLRTIGYGCAKTGHYDPQMRKCLIAFQRRYEPANMTGTPEPETIARLRALIRKCVAAANNN